VGSNKDQRCETALESVALLLNLPKSDITSHRDIGSIPHIFSHINMTYHIQHLIIESQKPPADTTDGRAVWLDEQGVEHANVGTGVKKVWAEVFGSWGSFEVGASGQKDKKVKAKPKPKPQVKVQAEDEVKKGGKVVKKVSMPAMPKRKALDPL
jgi:A/G-specific adenine glycosylase